MPSQSGPIYASSLHRRDRAWRVRRRRSRLRASTLLGGGTVAAVATLLVGHFT